VIVTSVAVDAHVTCVNHMKQRKWIVPGGRLVERMVAGTDYMAQQHGTARLTDPAAGHVTHSMQGCQQPQVSTSGFRE
jgi:hypothetical protein